MIEFLVKFLFFIGQLIDAAVMVGGLLAFAAVGWLIFSKRGRHMLLQLLLTEEYRCQECHAAATCPAYETGVLYPCPHYQETDL